MKSWPEKPLAVKSSGREGEDKTMIRQENYFGHYVGAIYVEGIPDAMGEGYFRAFVEIESIIDNNPAVTIVHSTSKKGLYLAAANLCKRLDKRFAYSFENMPFKWKVYLVNTEALLQISITKGYMTVREIKDGQCFRGDLYGPLFDLFLSELSEQEIEQREEAYIRKGIMNSAMDAVGQSGFGALGNLCKNLHRIGMAEEIDDLVLDPLSASFFLPAAKELDEE
jgi:hypothetical protein